MSTIAKLLKVLPALGLLGCVSDFTPEAHKGNPNALPESDAGKAADAGKPDAKAPMKDAGKPPASDDDTAGDDEGDDAPPDPKDGSIVKPSGGPCDLSGRWILTERSLSAAFGAKQISIGWHYFEIEQSGADLTVKRALFCGGTTSEAPGDIFKVNMDESGAWKSYQARTNYTGRKGTSAEAGDGCDVKFERDSLIRGMTIATYSDKSVPLPTLEQKADGTEPGWEDWDEDGNPGITMKVKTDLVNGDMYTSLRTFSDYAGSVEKNATTFKLRFNWEQQRIVLQTKPNDDITRGLLDSPASRAPDEVENTVEFARLDDGQAAGNDDATCTAIRELAPTLNPFANHK